MTSHRKETVWIFHLNGPEEGVFLHPFTDRAQMMKILDRKSVRGLYGTEPDLSQVNRLRSSLHELLDGAVRQWISDARFVPRFLLSALAFLCVYFAMTVRLVTELPVPTVLGISLFVGLSAYFLLGKRDLHSQWVLKRQLTLKAKIDAIRFDESEFIHKIESELARYAESIMLPEISMAISRDFGTNRYDLSDLAEHYPEETDALYRYLYRRFERYHEKNRMPTTLLRLSGSVATADPVRRRKANINRDEHALFVLYTRLKDELTSSR